MSYSISSQMFCHASLYIAYRKIDFSCQSGKPKNVIAAGGWIILLFIGKINPNGRNDDQVRKTGTI